MPSFKQLGVDSAGRELTQISSRPTKEQQLEERNEVIGAIKNFGTTCVGPSIGRAKSIGTTCAINVKLQGRHKVKAVLDTGAEKNIISHAVYNKLRPKPRSRGKVAMTGAGTDMRMNAFITEPIRFSIGSQEFFEEFYVAPIYDEMLLGLSFLMDHGTKIDLTTNTLFLGTNQVALQSDNRDLSHVYVSTTQSIVVEPNTVRVSRCSLSSPLKDFIVDSRDHVIHKRVLVPRVLNFGGQEATVCFFNISDDRVVIEKGEVVGCADEEWFHGSCVGVTSEEGAEMYEYICKDCQSPVVGDVSGNSSVEVRSQDSSEQPGGLRRSKRPRKPIVRTFYSQLCTPGVDWGPSWVVSCMYIFRGKGDIFNMPRCRRRSNRAPVRVRGLLRLQHYGTSYVGLMPGIRDPPEVEVMPSGIRVRREGESSRRVADFSVSVDPQDQRRIMVPEGRFREADWERLLRPARSSQCGICGLFCRHPRHHVKFQHLPGVFEPHREVNEMLMVLSAGLDVLAEGLLGPGHLGPDLVCHPALQTIPPNAGFEGRGLPLATFASASVSLGAEDDAGAIDEDLEELEPIELENIFTDHDLFLFRFIYFHYF
ncbi:hypothetical protein KUTeg_014624 [Tegillarca granosa]|uniref:Peptidase A2 domain-containing protein n=1 Tax=Tegillarca granosa TaxID=220873 RepID=A0ABQ9EV63_TEGGR|nr:hypothetical protein KUTeg_014624 [Tegillarca granosa]